MKTAVISALLLVSVIVFSVFCSVYICNICEKVEDFTKDLPESIEGLSEKEIKSLKEKCEKIYSDWNSNSGFLHITVPSQNVISVKAAMSKLLRSLESDNDGAYVEAKSELSVYPTLIKNAETVTFYNIF